METEELYRLMEKARARSLTEEPTNNYLIGTNNLILSASEGEVFSAALGNNEEVMLIKKGKTITILAFTFRSPFIIAKLIELSRTLQLLGFHTAVRQETYVEGADKKINTISKELLYELINGEEVPAP
jgi:hypothetical protein